MFALLALALVGLVAAPGPAPDPDVPTLAKAALAGDPDALPRLRALGQPGLDALVKLRRELSSVPPIFVGPQTETVKAWEALVDGVARQRYASASGLYWYTDLAAAKAEAKRQHKPILSLRLLGQLDSDFSCANSRFFRTILYPDPAIAQALHDGWILHWESVREVPKITIDFGDGRVLTRTITGNSLHYAMTADGEVTEVMPGMVGPRTFLGWLETAAGVTRDVAALPRAKRSRAIRAHLEADREARLTAWTLALRRIGVNVERAHGALVAATDEPTLERLAALKGAISISPEAQALVGAMMPRSLVRLLAVEAMPLAVGKSSVESPMLRQLGPVEGTLAKDEVQNELVMKLRLLTILLAGSDRTTAMGVPALTQAIYAEAFLTPLDDPWMGLAPPDVFTGLPPALEKSTAAN